MVGVGRETGQFKTVQEATDSVASMKSELGQPTSHFGRWAGSSNFAVAVAIVAVAGVASVASL